MSVLNIVELQNVVTSASGVTPISYLSNQLANIQEMVDYTRKQINVNAISNFNTSPIQIYSPLNLCNVSLSLNGSNTVGGIGTSVVSTLGTASTGLFMVGMSTGTGLSFLQGGVSTFVISPDSNATFSGTVTAAGFVTASDARLKHSVHPITDYETILSHVEGVRFQWNNMEGIVDIGVLAQNLLPVLPEAVQKGQDGYYRVEYMKLIPVLIQSVKSLQARVKALEGALKKRDDSPIRSE
jgi:hypothetical protein